MKLSADAVLTMAVYTAEPGSHPRRAEPARRLGATLDQAEAANVVDGL